MDKTNIDFVLNIFKTLSGELPDQLLYRENGDSFELRTLESIGNSMPADMQGSGWNIIGCQAAQTAMSTLQIA